MARTTNADLDAVCENLNDRLRARGAKARVLYERRNGYVALDEWRAATQVRTLTAGTAREVYDAMWNMIRGLDLLP